MRWPMSWSSVPEREGAVLSLCENVKEKRGAGLEGLLDGVTVRAGSLTYVLDGQQLPSWATAGQESLQRAARGAGCSVYLWSAGSNLYVR